MDLWKAYDCIPQNLLIAKLEGYGIDKASLRLLLDYLTRIKKRTKIALSFSCWCDINTGKPHRSILGPPLFKKFINDLFLFLKKATVFNFAADNIIYCGEKKSDLIFFNLNNDISNKKGFRNNSVKANSESSNLWSWVPIRMALLA